MEDTKGIEAAPLVDQSDHKDNYEAQGARPKQKSPQKEPCLTYCIHFIQCFRPESRETASLQILDTHLNFTGCFTAKPESKDVRYASKFEYETGKECIHLSYYNHESDCVSNIFFTTLTNLEECLMKLRDLLYRKLQPHAMSPQSMEHASRVLKKQPIYIGWSRVTVHNKLDDKSKVPMEPPPSDAAEYLVILDLECVSLYLNNMVVPEVQLMFWEKETPKSVETVKHHHAQNFIFLESNTQAIIMEAKEDIILNLRILRPKKVNFMQDAEEFLAYAPQIEPDMPFYLRDDAESRRSNNAAASWDTSEAVREVRTLRADLENALIYFKDNDDFQNIWITQQFDMEELVREGKVPKSDASSGGLDPNSGEHFKKALMDIADHLKEGDFPTAMSRVVAVREVFRESTAVDIGEFLQDFDNMEILKRLYFKSLVQ